jgi:cellulose synthase/poly-beta-1,6-N-acetylglucosamine synthase-like glycosyltransferase
LTTGTAVIQFRYAVRDEESSPLVALRAAALAARTYLRPLGRTRIGGTAGLFGNGMVFRSDVLRSVRWTSHLTEDAELQLELLERGIKVAFAPCARVEAEMPNTLEAAQTQHARWERGRIELARRFVPRLLRQALAGGTAGRIAALDSAVDLLIPPLSVVVASNVAWSGLALARWFAAPTRRHRRSVVLSGVAVAVHAGYVLSALRMVDAPAAVYKSLLGAPRLVVWKLGLWTQALLRPSGIEWSRTSRNMPSTAE